MKPKTRPLYLLEWYDIEGDAGWGPGAKKPPLVVQPCFILKRPSKKQEVPCYIVCTAFCEDEPGGAIIIPAAVVKGQPRVIATVDMRYR